MSDIKHQATILLMEAMRDVYILKSNPYKNTHRNKTGFRLKKLQNDLNYRCAVAVINGSGYKFNKKEVHILAEKIVEESLYRQSRNQGFNPSNDSAYNKIHKDLSKQYTDIVSDRLKKNTISAQKKMQEIFEKGMKGHISKQELKKQLTNNFQTNNKNSYSIRWARKDGTLIRNPSDYTERELKEMGAYKKKVPSKTGIQYRKLDQLVDDMLHSNINANSLQNALDVGYNYKKWTNGRSRSKVRLWHRASQISPVLIEEPFELYGSHKALMMYPGDLEGGAENVANCHCGVEYTDEKPDGLKSPGKQNTTYNNFKNSENFFFSRKHTKTFDDIGTLEFNKRKYTNKKTNIYTQTNSENILSNNDIIKAIDDLPKKLKNIKKDIYVVNASHPRSNTGQGGGMRIRGTNEIILFVTKNTPKRDYIKHILPHEITHLLKNINYNTYKNQVLLDDMNFQLHNKRIDYPSPYAKQKKLDGYDYWYREDLAESVAIYLKNPRKFERNFPNRSDFIKNILEL